MLTQTLTTLTSAPGTETVLSGGLRLKFKNDGGRNRLLCYRRGARPSWMELGMVRRELESRIAPGRVVAGSGYWRHGEYECFTFSWEVAM